MKIESIQKLVDEHIKEKRLEHEKSGKYSPGKFGRCFRMQYLNKEKIAPSEVTTERELRVFEVGNILHEFVQQLFAEEDKEVKIEEGDIIGFADIVTEDEVIDIKSVHSKAFWYMAVENYNIVNEKRNNLLQVCYYAMMLKRPKMRLAFISRDDLSIMEFGFFTDKYIPLVENEIKVLRSLQSMPDAMPRTNWDCKYCPYKTYCGDIEIGEGRPLPWVKS